MRLRDTTPILWLAGLCLILGYAVGSLPWATL